MKWFDKIHSHSAMWNNLEYKIITGHDTPVYELNTGIYELLADIPIFNP